MNITYDPEADAVYIELRKGAYERSEEVKPGFIIDLDKEGEPLGIEILDVKRRVAIPKSLAVKIKLLGRRAKRGVKE